MAVDFTSIFQQHKQGRGALKRTGPRTRTVSLSTVLSKIRVPKRSVHVKYESIGAQDFAENLPRLPLGQKGS